ncbi:unnamed protein product [Larinioides sclopetarius]|uniref:Uncharacterized protein n=1 Tax=Larinioides sclopetarius TaxID=280406 RepID=A0AAV2AWK3_9ARAC
MSIGFIIFLTTLWLSIPASVTYSVEDLMRSILKKIMTCPISKDGYITQKPVAAFSPARYMQLIALVKKDSKELICGRSKPVPFFLNDPRTWNFCAIGLCLSDECTCFRDFSGEKCNKFQGKCWLFYCFLTGCKFELPSLHCACDSSLYGQTVSSGIYFYDHGIERTYRSPPIGFATIYVIEAPVIRETDLGDFSYQINLYKNMEARPKRFERVRYINPDNKKFQENDNRSPDYRNWQDENSDYAFRKPVVPFSRRNFNTLSEGGYPKRIKKLFRSLEVTGDDNYLQTLKHPDTFDDWEETNPYNRPRPFSRFSRNSINHMGNFDFEEQQFNPGVRPEFSTTRILWSDSEEEEGML